MPYTIRTSIQVRGELRVLTGTFDDDEHTTLDAYCGYALQLQATKLVRDGGPGQLSMDFKQGVGWSYKANLPPDDEIIALLHRIRPFILKDEPTNFYRICSLISRIVQDSDMRLMIKRLKKHYSGKSFQSMATFAANGTILNSEETLLMWLNAHEYHKDRDKQFELDKLHQLMPLEASRAIFIMMIYSKVQSIFALAGVIETLLGRQKQCTLTV